MAHQAPLRDLAVLVLELVVGRDPAAEDAADELAARVTELPLVALALRVAAGGPFKITHAIDLAKLVIDQGVGSAPESATGGASA